MDKQQLNNNFEDNSKDSKPKVIFNKKPLTIEEQIDLLEQRGLIIKDKAKAEQFLKYANYYRLSSYMRAFQIGLEHNFIANTNFNNIVDLYNFDKELRNLTFTHIKQIEVGFRAVLSRVLCLNYGSHWFYDDESFHNEENKQKTINIINSEIQYNNKYKDTFIKYYYKKYSSPEHPPFWMITEVLSMGNLSKIYSLLNKKSQKLVAKELNYPVDIIKSWIHSLTTIRNITAHHSRLWNRRFTIRPKQHKKFDYPQNYNDASFYAQSLIIEALLKEINPENNWNTLLNELFKKYSFIDKRKIGF